MNQISLIGRLTRDPVRTKKGLVYTGIAVNYGKNNPPEYFDLIFPEYLYDVVMKYTHKGSRIGVNGQIKLNKTETYTGITVYVSSLTLCDSKKEN